MKGVHFQIVINNSEWGNIFILKQNVPTFSAESCVSNKNCFRCQKCQYYKKCQKCLMENVSIYVVLTGQETTSTVNKTYSDGQFLSQSDKIDFDKSLAKQLDNHMTSRDCRKTCHSKQLITIAMSGYFLSQFYKTLLCSPNYRYFVMQNFFYLKPLIKHKDNFQCISISVVTLGYGVIDYKWNDILLNMCIERRELDNAMSWLSTLGGAFSALGEQHTHFARLAGRTSLEQFNLALRLGDDMIVSRCKLYYALSLIQTGRLAIARKIIKQQYEFATSHVAVDKRLVRMCLGIWARMKFEYKRKNLQKLSVNS